MLIKINNLTRQVVTWYGGVPNVNESVKIVNSLPEDRNEYEYYYVNGQLQKGEQKQVNITLEEIADTLVDHEVRLIEMELFSDLDYEYFGVE